MMDAQEVNRMHAVCGWSEPFPKHGLGMPLSAKQGIALVKLSVNGSSGTAGTFDTVVVPSSIDGL